MARAVCGRCLEPDGSSQLAKSSNGFPARCGTGYLGDIGVPARSGAIQRQRLGAITEIAETRARLGGGRLNRKHLRSLVPSPSELSVKRVRGQTSFDGLERVSTQALMDILQVPQRQRTAGTYRYLATLMAELNWSQCVCGTSTAAASESRFAVTFATRAVHEHAAH